MLRTGQAHTIKQMAASLGQRYLYGLEFLELNPMPPPPGHPVIGDDNEFGFHGNGIISVLPVAEPVVIRLDEVADWFVAPKGGQRRVGNRMAVAATVAFGTTRFVACSVHLESATDGMGRVTQMRDAARRARPVCGQPAGADRWRPQHPRASAGGHENPSEPLFSLARKRGYDFATCNLAAPTTRTSIWSESEGTRQLDWFCARGLATSEPQIVPSLGPDGRVLTDHELILVTIG